MKITDIPHNMNITLNDEMVEVAENANDMKEGVLFLLDELSKEEGPVKKGQIASMAGVYSRVLGDFEASERLLKEAEDHFQAAGKTLMTCYSKSRLAVTYSAAGKYAPADSSFEECIHKLSKAKNNPKAEKIIIYCMDHWARSKFARQFYQEALDIFLEAHEREMINGDIENMNQLSQFISKLKKIVEDKEAELAEAEEQKRQIEKDFKNSSGE